MRRLLVALVCLGFFAAARPAFGQVTYSIVKSLPGAGSALAPVIIRGADGNLYGTRDGAGAFGFGYAFKIDTGGTMTVLYDFPAWNRPSGLMQASDGNLYGTTYEGGPGTLGTVFRLTTAGVFTTLHVITHPGAFRPRGSMIEGTDGWLYGTLAEGGGASEGGGFFKISTSGSFVRLANYSTNHQPRGALVEATDGNFYGTTFEGGTSGLGTVMRMTPAGAVTTIHSFSGVDGANPVAGLIQGSDGLLYGTTSAGGSSDLGPVFAIGLAGSLTVLHQFSGSDGRNPAAALVEAGDGHLYGTTKGQGFGACGLITTHGGLFRIERTGANLANLHTFNSCAFDGHKPETQMVEGPGGTLHGMTTFGGNAGGGGTVYRVTFAVATTTTLNVSPTWAVYGENVTLTATVTGGSPTGSVRFFDGATDIGLVPVADGMAVLNPTLAVGAHSFTAAFEPTGAYVASESDPVDLTVNPAPTATLLTVTPGTSVLFGEAVTLTANVVPGAGTPTGSVQFFDGATLLGTVPLSGGAAMLATSALAIGAHPITVVYPGDGNFAGSASDPTTVTVNTIYTFGGFEQPLLPDGSASIQQNNAGRTIPVKFWLTLNGQRTGAAIANIAVYKVLDVALGTVDTTNLTEDSGTANDSGTRFRYDPVAQHYVFNLSTRGWSAPATYRIVVTLNDGGVYWVNFSLR